MKLTESRLKDMIREELEEIALERESIMTEQSTTEQTLSRIAQNQDAYFKVLRGDLKIMRQILDDLYKRRGGGTVRTIDTGSIGDPPSGVPDKRPPV